MHANPSITLTVELSIPLTLVNKLAAEADRLQISIPEMLSQHLIEAEREREEKEFEDATMQRVQGNGFTFDDSLVSESQILRELGRIDAPAPTPPGGVEPTEGHA